MDGQYWHEQRRFTLRNLRDYGFGRRFETLERMMGEQIQNIVDFIKYTKHSSPDKVREIDCLPFLLKMIVLNLF